MWYEIFLKRIIRSTEFIETEPDSEKKAEEKAKILEKQYPEFKGLKSLNDYGFGVLKGKLSMIYWTLGHEMNYLDATANEDN